uniref:Uncharacterized protein n=1 Tax=Cacopsylla melanoneura TaxID=428564 RepID=A0A8D8Z2Q6_9HEMI
MLVFRVCIKITVTICRYTRGTAIECGTTYGVSAGGALRKHLCPFALFRISNSQPDGKNYFTFLPLPFPLYLYSYIYLFTCLPSLLYSFLLFYYLSPNPNQAVLTVKKI